MSLEFDAAALAEVSDRGRWLSGAGKKMTFVRAQGEAVVGTFAEVVDDVPDSTDSSDRASDCEVVVDGDRRGEARRGGAALVQRLHGQGKNERAERVALTNAFG